MDELEVGQIVDQVTFDIERGKIREFARATHATDPAHTGDAAARAAGFDDVPATPTHVVVAGHQRDQRKFVALLGLRLDRIVVGSVHWEYVRPLIAGDAVHGTRRVVADERKVGKRGGTMRLVTLETEYTDVAGEVVVRQHEVLVERGGDA